MKKNIVLGLAALAVVLASGFIMRTMQVEMDDALTIQVD